ncbi:MAG: type I methionyl aminopeptidase, partial [Chloroflexota bacterium]
MSTLSGTAGSAAGSTAPLGTLVPGVISPRRAVPASIPRPEYVDRDAPAKYTGPEVKDAETIERMRVAG